MENALAAGWMFRYNHELELYAQDDKYEEGEKGKRRYKGAKNCRLSQKQIYRQTRTLKPHGG